MNNRKNRSLVERIDFASIIKDVFREWWVILLVAVSVSILAYVFVDSKYVEEYTVSSTFVVTAKGMNTNIYQNLTSTKDLAENFSYILESNVLKSKVKEDLGLTSFNAVTNVESLEETNLLRLTVMAGKPLEAYKIMQSIMANYNQVSDYVISNVVLEVIKPAVIPTAPSNYSNANTVFKQVFIVSTVLLILGVAIMSYLKDTVKNKEEVSEKIDTTLLGIVCHERKAKTLKEMKKVKHISMLITNPLLSFRFVESNKMMASRTRSAMDKHGHKVLLVTSVIENEGKSTVAANIALSLVQEGKKVLLIDCDFRKPAQYKIFEVPEKDIVDLPAILEGELDLSIAQNMYGDTGLYAIFNKKTTGKLEQLLEQGGFQKFIELIKDDMDYIILDTSPMALVSDTEELAQVVDASVLVVREDMVLAKDINDAIDRLEDTNSELIGCIFNDATSGFAADVSRYGYGGYYGYGRGYGYGKRYGYGSRYGYGAAGEEKSSRKK